MKKLFACLICFFLFTGCYRRPPVPAYYEVPRHFMRGDPELYRIIRLGSVDLELLEWAVFDETNRQRRRLGLLELEYDYSLQAGARQHSDEMVTLAYFDHISPVRDYETITMRLKKVGIKNGMGGENIAVHPVRRKQETVFKVANNSKSIRQMWRNTGSAYTYDEFARDLVRRWLNSKGHRHNILNRKFRFLGVGVTPGYFNDTDVFYVTQNFSSTNY